MDIAAYTRKLQTALHPEPYPHVLATGSSAYALALLRKPFLMGKYCLGIAPWRTDLEPQIYLKQLRREAQKICKAWPIISQVGLYLVLAGAEAAWRPAVGVLKPDKTGAQTVILQAVHFVDLASGVKEVAVSQWGPVKFGWFHDVKQALEAGE